MKEVVFLGCNEHQMNWGSYTGDVSELVVGEKYIVEKEEIHSWHTKVFLKGIDGSFNSTCFDLQ
jgi:hypothetical protein